MPDVCSPDRVIQYRERRLPPRELRNLLAHGATCETCRTQMLNGSAHDAILRVAAAVDDEGHEHLAYQDLSAYADGDLDEVDREIVDSKVADCRLCSEDLKTLRDLRSAQRRIVPFPRNRSMYVAAAAAVAIAFGIVTYEWTRPKQATSTAPARSARAVQPRVAPPPVTPPAMPAAPPAGVPLVIALHDNGGVIGIDKSGRVVGVEAVDRATVRTATALLKGEKIEASRALDRVRKNRGVLLGNAEPAAPRVRLLSPVGAVIETPQPTFRWTPVPAATYVVSIFNSHYEQAFSSGPLDSASWTMPVPLQRGETYSWQVTVSINGRDIRYPVPPDPEAKFAIVSAREAARLQTLATSFAGSHLIMGSAYWNAGLLDRAEEEFRRLAANNPDSKAAQRALSRVQAARSIR